MKKLIIHGDPGVRKDGKIRVDDEEYVCFGISRQGEWHGPDRVQLWCTVGSEDERETFERREYVSMHLDTTDVDAADVEVLQKKGTA
ncbi:MAG: HAH_0734 family protein [Haloarculaceae archaeon]